MNESEIRELHRLCTNVRTARAWDGEPYCGVCGHRIAGVQHSGFCEACALKWAQALPEILNRFKVVAETLTYLYRDNGFPRRDIPALNHVTGMAELMCGISPFVPDPILEPTQYNRVREGK